MAVVYAAPAAGPDWTVGFIVSKAVGNSVVRHRVTRRLRAVAAELVPKVRPPQDVVVRALPAACDASQSDLSDAVRAGLAKAVRTPVGGHV